MKRLLKEHFGSLFHLPFLSLKFVENMTFFEKSFTFSEK